MKPLWVDFPADRETFAIQDEHLVGAYKKIVLLPNNHRSILFFWMWRYWMNHKCSERILPEEPGKSEFLMRNVCYCYGMNSLLLVKI